MHGLDGTHQECLAMKIQINEQRCTGCGGCMEVCPADAIGLVSGVAVVNQGICTQCQACIDACPAGAISAVPDTSMVLQQPTTLSTIAEARPILTKPRPWLASALAFAGREILPRLVDVLVDTVEHRLTRSTTAAIANPASMSSRNFIAQGQGQRRQVCFRGGRNGNQHFRQRR